MAEITATAQQVNLWASHHVSVKQGMDYITFEMTSLADSLLVAHRHDGHARVFRVYTKVDWYIVLEDTDPKGLGALSIEYGHSAYVRRYRRADGSLFEVTIPASEPTFILTNSTGIKRKGQPIKVPKSFKNKVYRKQTGLDGLRGRTG